MVRDLPNEQLLKLLDECVNFHAQLAEASLQARQYGLFEDETRFVQLRMDLLSLKLEILELIRTTNQPTEAVKKKLSALRARAKALMREWGKPGGSAPEK